MATDCHVTPSQTNLVFLKCLTESLKNYRYLLFKPSKRCLLWHCNKWLLFLSWKSIFVFRLCQFFILVKNGKGYLICLVIVKLFSNHSYKLFYNGSLSTLLIGDPGVLVFFNLSLSVHQWPWYSFILQDLSCPRNWDMVLRNLYGLQSNELCGQYYLMV